MIVKNAGWAKQPWLMLLTQKKEKQKRRGKSAYLRGKL